MLVTAPMTIEAIETSYRGYHTRSRLEARYMVLLDALGVEFVYEKETYCLANDVWYLPDKWIDRQPLWHDPCWIELKGRLPTREELRKCILLARLTGHPVYLLWGDCWRPDERYKQFGYDGGMVLRPDFTFDLHQWLYWCPVCERAGFAMYGVCPCKNAAAATSEKLVRAYAAARGKRFERENDEDTYVSQEDRRGNRRLPGNVGGVARQSIDADDTPSRTARKDTLVRGSEAQT